MNKLWVICTAGVLLCTELRAQENDTAATQSVALSMRDTTPILQTTSTEKPKIYKVNNALEIPLTAAATAWTLYGFSVVYSKDESSGEQILGLSKKDVPRFDRWGIRPYNKKIDDASYIPFYSSMPVPLFFLLDKKMRKDFVKLSFMYLETMSITGVLYTGSTYMVDRYRPYAYDDRTEFDFRRRGGAKNSFYAGHVALVATSTFFFAQTWADYHPTSKLKWLFYGVATAATGATAYMRHRGGLHFPSDIALGIAQGTLTGIMVPRLHRTKFFKEHNVSFVPYVGPEATKGLAMMYRF